MLIVPLLTLSAPAEVVVLRNGNVIEGNVEQLLDRIVVRDGTARVTHLSIREVDYVVPNLRAAYSRRLKRLGEHDIHGHVLLAQWCLRHGLNHEAADRLLHISRVEPGHPSVAALEKQMQQRHDRKDSGGPEELAGVTPNSVASAREANTREPMPNEVVSEFTRAIQPLLINRCGQAACHGATGRSEYHISRGPRHSINQEQTWENLRETTAWVDLTGNGTSRLLEMAQTAHGNSPTPPFRRHELRQFERLRAWVDQLASGHESLELAGQTTESVATEGEALRSESPVRPASFEQFAPNPQDADLADPFDPAPFNARQISAGTR